MQTYCRLSMLLIEILSTGSKDPREHTVTQVEQQQTRHCCVM